MVAAGVSAGGQVGFSEAKLMSALQPVTISIITPSLNCARYVGAAVESVMNQAVTGLEHIIVDGGSTDATLAILQSYPHLRVIHGPDAGIYDAVNKGIARSSGAVIGILAADDVYSHHALDGVTGQFEDSRVDAVAGRAESFDERQARATPFAAAGDDLLFHSTLGNPTINAWFFRRTVFEKLGGFNSAYRVAGDREFMLRFACSELRHSSIPQLIYRYRVHGRSTTFSGNDAVWHTVMHEHAMMTQEFLRRDGLSRVARALIRKARSRDTLVAARYAMRNRQWRHFSFYASAGWRHDALWPLRLLRV